jgi:hypothetical protein
MVWISKKISFFLQVSIYIHSCKTLLQGLTLYFELFILSGLKGFYFHYPTYPSKYGFVTTRVIVTK